MECLHWNCFIIFVLILPSESPIYLVCSFFSCLLPLEIGNACKSYTISTKTNAEKPCDVMNIHFGIRPKKRNMKICKVRRSTEPIHFKASQSISNFPEMCIDGEKQQQLRLPLNEDIRCGLRPTGVTFILFSIWILYVELNVLLSTTTKRPHATT